MKLKTYFLFALVCLIGITGCKEDDDTNLTSNNNNTTNNNNNNNINGPTGSNCANAWSTELQNEANAMANAATAYANNPSTANCNDWVDAIRDYLNALRPYTNCPTLTTQERSNLEQAIQIAEDNLNGAC